MDARRVRAVLCDMDGLLLDSERLSMRALADAAAEQGVTLSEAFCRGQIGSPMDRCAALVAASHGPAFSTARLMQRHEALMDERVAAGGLSPRPGVAALLDRLDAMRLPRAVVTSSRRHRAETHLAHLDLLRRFDLLVTRDDVSRPKPDPEPYLLAAQRLGIAPEHCLALEDSPTGVRAAHAAGVPVAMVPDLLDATPDSRARAFLVATDLGEIAALLGEAAAGRA